MDWGEEEGKIFSKFSDYEKLASFYFIGLAVLNLFMDSINGRFVFFDIIFVILAGLPLVVHKKWMYQWFGGIISLLCLYIVFAVLISNIKDVQQNQVQPLWTYGMGYVFSLLTLYFGVLMTGLININCRKLVV